MQALGAVVMTAAVVAATTWSTAAAACEVNPPRLEELPFAIEGQRVARNVTFISDDLTADDASLQIFLAHDGVERAVSVDKGPLSRGLFLALDEPLPTGDHTLRIVREHESIPELSEERRIEFVVTEAIDTRPSTATTTSTSLRVGNTDPGDDDTCFGYFGDPGTLARIDATAVDGDEAVLLVDGPALLSTRVVPYIDGVARFEEIVGITPGDTSDDGDTSDFDVRVVDFAGNIGPVERVTVVLAQGCAGGGAGSSLSLFALLLLRRRRPRGM